MSGSSNPQPNSLAPKPHQQDMPRSLDDLLLAEVGNEKPRGVERCLAAGASINGSPQSGEEFPPIVYAAAVGSARMIEFLAKKGADLDGAVWRRCSFPKDSRAIHVAIGSGNAGTLGALRALLRAGANVDAKDAQGCTALMMACRVQKDAAARVEMARELLAAGADVNLRDGEGRVALSYATFSGHADLIRLLLSEPSLSTLNHATLDGKTPLLVAVEFNHVAAVSLLLSAGASQEGVLHGDNYNCPFRGAVAKGNEDIVRLLATARGMDAVGGASQVLPGALARVTKPGASRIINLVLGAMGEEKRAALANCRVVANRPLLHLAAGYGALANVKVLLAAGAIETARDSQGLTARQVIGRYLPGEGGVDTRIRAAIARALAQGPAYRARSLAWPVEEGGGAGGGAVAPLGVKIYRPTSPRVFGRLATLVSR